MKHEINDICQERHIDIKTRVDKLEVKTNELEIQGASTFEKMDNLTKSISGLTATLQWGIGLIVPALIGVIIKIVLGG